MAEGLLRSMAGDMWEVYSAGTRPTTVNHRAIEVMNEIGIDISHHTSNHMDDYKNIEFNVVVSVCNAAQASCPVAQAKKSIHWDVMDPAEARGTDDAVIKVFRQIRDELKLKIYNFIETGKINSDGLL